MNLRLLKRSTSAYAPLKSSVGSIMSQKMVFHSWYSCSASLYFVARTSEVASLCSLLISSFVGGPSRIHRGIFGCDVRMASSTSSTHVSRSRGDARGDHRWTSLPLNRLSAFGLSSAVGRESNRTDTIGDDVHEGRDIPVSGLPLMGVSRPR